MPYIDPSTIEQVKRIDLLSYLQMNEPGELVRLGNDNYCTKTHDSLKISNGRWFWWSRGFGGYNALDYLTKVKGMSFLEAVRELDAGAVSVVLTRAPKHRADKQGFLLPRRADSDVHAECYLKLRGIDPVIIKHCLDSRLIFETTRIGRPHVVFVGYDKSGIARYAALRSCGGDFKGEVAGSDKRFAFRMLAINRADAVHVFECAIDLLSFATLTDGSGKDFRELNLLSLGGIPPVGAVQDIGRIPQALDQYLRDNPLTETVCLHLDNDDPGIKVARIIASALNGRGLNVSISPPPAGKDVNEYLLMCSTAAGLKYTLSTSTNPELSASVKSAERRER